jgi:hypothetical protein
MFTQSPNTSFVTPEKRTTPKDYSPGKKASHKITDEKMAKIKASVSKFIL